jgi:hypothetical protein
VPPRLLALLAAAALAAAPASAQGPSVRAEVDANRMGVDDQVQFTIVIEGSADLTGPLVPPALKNLRLVSGPNQSTQVSITNGGMTRTVSLIYVLQPLAAGRAEIGPVHVRLSSGEKTTAPLALEVVPGSIRPSRPQPRSLLEEAFGGDPFGSRSDRGRPRAEPKVMMTAVASRSRAYVGEPILVTYYMYTQANVASVQLTDAPQFPGFWTEDPEQSKSAPQGERTIQGGETYIRFAIGRRLIFPTRAGTLTIPPASFRVSLARLSVFDGGGTVERSTPPLQITADPVPTTPDFSGAVGEFQVRAALDRDTVGLGQAATLRFTVQGSGNLKWVERGPQLAVPGARVYPPQVKSDLKVGLDGIKGSKTWEFVIVPETNGALTIPALPFSYFAPASGAVKHLESPPLTVPVQGAGAAAAPGVPAAPARPAARPDGLALRSDLDPPTRPLPEPGARVLLMGLGLVLLLHGLVAGGSLWSQRRAAAPGRAAPRQNVRRALGDLEQARRGGLSKEQAAALIERTLHGVFGPVDENGAGPVSDRERAIREVLQQVQFIRYAPQLGDYSEQIGSVAARAAEVVRKWA